MLVTVLQTSRGSFAKWTERSVVVMSHLLPRLKQQQVHSVILDALLWVQFVCL